MPLYKPKGREDGPYYALFKNHLGVWERKTTSCIDRRAAEAKLKQFERTASDPDGAIQNTASISTALELLIEDRASQAAAGKRSEETVGFYRKKSGCIVAVLGRDFPLRMVNAACVDDYIKARRNHGAGENSISKELTTWRGAMKLAKRRRIWIGDLDEVFPSGFSPEYEPRERWLTPEEVLKFQAVMKPHRFAVLAFSVATSAEWAALWRATLDDALYAREHDYSEIPVRGSKNKHRDRLIPLVLAGHAYLLAEAIRLADGDGFLLFRYNHNFRKHLLDAVAEIYPCSTCKPGKRTCEACRAVRVSPNDLRRTHGRWLRLAGIEPSSIAPVMGHADSRMVERVYGKATPKELAKVMASRLVQ